MSPLFYSILHLSSLLALGIVLGALWGIYTHKDRPIKIRSLLLTLHGLIMFFILLAGFALIAKTDLSFPWPFWIYVKLLIWLLLGLAPLFIKKSGDIFLSSRKHFFVLFLFFSLMVLAVLLVRLKSFF